MLFISGADLTTAETALATCFNLVIEMLFISGFGVLTNSAPVGLFQSRN